MPDPRDKPTPEPKREGGVNSPEKTPANENTRVEEAAPKPREDGRDGGMIGEG